MKKALQANFRRCFISAGGRTDLSLLLTALKERDITPIAPEPGFLSGMTAFEATASAIKNSDFVIGVLTRESGDSNVAFELGYAHALHKPVLLIGELVTDVPVDLSSFLFVTKGLANLDGLRFNLEQFLGASSAGKRTTINDRPPRQDVGPVVPRKKALAVRNHSLESNLESDLAELLLTNGADIVRSSNRPDQGADLAVWVSELGSLVGNPFLIEVKARIDNQEGGRKASDQAYKYLHDSGARLILIVYKVGPRSDELNQGSASPGLFFYRLDEFTKDVSDRGITKVVRRLRNRLVHGAG